MATGDLRHLISDAPRVMVADGSRLVRKLIADVLERELPGVQVIGCSSIAEARAALEQGPVDLVTTALTLADGDGLELARCAAQVAALDAAPCSGYDAVATDAAEPEQAYARYLRGQLSAADVALLPKAQQAIATQQAAQAAATLAAIEDPLSRLVAAGALAVRGPLPMAVVQQAVDTASAQGWRRALLAWLINQQRLAQEQGDSALAAQVQRRLDLLQAVPASK